MSQLLSNKWRKMSGMVAMLLTFLVVGMVDAGAQTAQTPANGVNPRQPEASMHGITPYALGTFTPANGLSDLDTYISTNRPVLDNASLDTRFRYVYFSLVYADVNNLYIAPEISLVSNLSRAAKQVGNITKPMMVNAYNTAVTYFQF